LHQHEDAFGNITHSFTADGGFTELTVSVEGEVDTQDTNGVITGTLERFPPGLFLRETPLTEADSAIADFAEAARADGGAERLAQLHALLRALHGEMTFDTDPTQPSTTAAEAFQLRRGVCQDLTHVFIAAARHLGFPARYIGGHLYRSDGVTDQEAGHAWAEAYVDDLGWIAFDPTHGLCATEAYVRIAAGLDYLGAAPVRGTRYGGGGETLKVAIHVDQSQRQSQN
ncbi:MAG TPA: transglutaminase family protein, partial [Pseudolabrys sp.]|nr:transglutaminase family protein [Pseudolabrys sp.]